MPLVRSWIACIFSSVAVGLVVGALTWNCLFYVDLEVAGNPNAMTRMYCEWDRRSFTDDTEEQLYSENATEGEEQCAGFVSTSPLYFSLPLNIPFVINHLTFIRNVSKST